MSVSNVSVEAQQNKEHAVSGLCQLVVFRLGEGSYGLDIQVVREINLLVDVTPIPKAPDYMEGTINLRGTIIPVVNLGLLLGLTGKVENNNSRQIIIARTEYGPIGYIVDAVSEVIAVPFDSIEPTSEGLRAVNHKYFAGIARLEENLVTIVDFSSLLQMDRVLLEEFKHGLVR